jgi:hypothetical protein
VAYTGPERRQADRSHAPSNDYDREYAFASRVSANWSAARLYARLWVLMRELPYYEDLWGEVDALTDLLCKHRPPD